MVVKDDQQHRTGRAEPATTCAGGWAAARTWPGLPLYMAAPKDVCILQWIIANETLDNVIIVTAKPWPLGLSGKR